MRRTRLWLLGSVAVLLPVVPGCILILPGIQRVELVVTALGSNQRVAEAIVTIGAAQAVGLEFGVESIYCDELTPEECLDQYAALGAFGGTYVASTDVDGHVALVVATTSVCEPPTTCCPLDPCANDPDDHVTGVQFHVRVVTEASSEILTVEFTPGNTVSGEFFEVTVLSIGEPVEFVSTPVAR